MALQEGKEDDIQYDCQTNGGKITNRDVWNIANKKPLKLVVVHPNTDVAFLIDRRTFGRYISSATRGAKYYCERRDPKTWYAEVGLDIGTDPCEFCKFQESPKCDRSTLKVIEEDVLLLEEAVFNQD